MAQRTATLFEKLERIFAHSAMTYTALEMMSLSELLYFALAESREDQGKLRDGAMQGS